MQKLTFILLLTLILSSFSLPDEGMFPLSEIGKVDLKNAGLRIPVSEVYNPNGVSLTDALVNISGCTGSFVSDNGLIITNHHCAFEAVAKASTPEKDYLKNGFVARTADMEIEGKGLTCRITESYEDVSEKVLAAGKDIEDPAERLKAINAKMLELARTEEKNNKSIKAEVSEMFIGRTYVLFRYRTILDVRLVYIPQRSIGEFGGETDNWVWPRHTGDFSFVRAYTAPDGSPASYSVNNVPYKPKKFLKVNPKGIKENDFVFILGYPGRTFRHRPARFIEYQQNHLLPYISNLYSFQNEQMEIASANDNDRLIQASRIKRNANVLKNYQGKLKGLRNLNIVAGKKVEDQALQNFINSTSELRKKYGNLLADITKLYDEIDAQAPQTMWFAQVYNSSNVLSNALDMNIFENKKSGLTKDSLVNYIKSKSPILAKTIAKQNEDYVIKADRILLDKMMLDACKFHVDLKVNALNKICAQSNQSISDFLNKVYSKKYLSEKGEILSGNPILAFENELNKQNIKVKADNTRRDGQLSKLMADYVNVKEKFLNKNFIPDANSTLRLTYGYVRGNSPVDGLRVSPVTSIAGIIEKGNSGNLDYAYPAIIQELYQKKDFGQFANPETGSVPVAFLYNLDTTGGNSGSPVMDADGNLVGVNFDRSYEATINDYAWNEAYSRSIGVDIRYVLWVAQKIDKADFLLKELNVN